MRHQLLRGRHRGSIRKQGTHDRLLHRQQGIRAHRFRQPCIHLGRTVEPATALQLHQLGLAQLGAEVGRGFPPAPAMQRLGVEQKPIQIEQASGRWQFHPGMAMPSSILSHRLHHRPTD